VIEENALEGIKKIAAPVGVIAGEFLCTLKFE
jgi:hypothetical protein